jgi:GNAT superfamily N-acetyltransferase
MTVTSTPARSTAEQLPAVVEVFARGFAFTRSFTHPYLVDRVGPVWALADETRKRAADYRREEYIACGVTPPEVDRIARASTRGGFAISAIRAADEPDGPLRDAYKALGYRLGSTEPVMAHRLRRIPRLREPFPVRRVTTQHVADRLAKAARSRQVLPEHFGPGSPMRQYVALDRDTIVGWVRSIAVKPAATWVSNMYVLPQYRRRGVGRSMLAKMLRDDRAAGATLSVLTASHTGALLYPVVGYELIGMLYLFTPTRR